MADTYVSDECIMPGLTAFDVKWEGLHRVIKRLSKNLLDTYGLWMSTDGDWFNRDDHGNAL